MKDISESDFFVCVCMSCISWDFVQVITCTKSCTSCNLYG